MPAGRYFGEGGDEFLRVLVEVADEDGHHLGERRRFAAEGHGPGALGGGEAAEEGDEGRAVGPHLGEQLLGVVAGTFGDTRPVPIVDFEVGGVGEVIAGFGYPGADPDADELAEVVGGHVGEELAS